MKFKGWAIPLKEAFFKEKKEDKDLVMIGPNRLENKILEVLLGDAEDAEKVKTFTFTQLLEECQVDAREWNKVKKILDRFEAVGLVECTRKTYFIYLSASPQKVEETQYKLTPSGFVLASIVAGLPEKYPFIDFTFVIKSITEVTNKG